MAALPSNVKDVDARTIDVRIARVRICFSLPNVIFDLALCRAGWLPILPTAVDLIGVCANAAKAASIRSS
jgi:hypothetical protein